MKVNEQSVDRYLRIAGLWLTSLNSIVTPVSRSESNIARLSFDERVRFVSFERMKAKNMKGRKLASRAELAAVASLFLESTKYDLLEYWRIFDVS